MLNHVRVTKAKLLATLKENKGKHVAEYRSAVTAYREKAVVTLTQRAKDISAGTTLSVEFDLPRPETFEDEYDRAIAMVDWSVEDELDLSEGDFRAYVLDEWSWRRQFASSTRVYNN